MWLNCGCDSITAVILAGDSRLRDNSKLRVSKVSIIKNYSTLLTLIVNLLGIHLIRQSPEVMSSSFHFKYNIIYIENVYIYKWDERQFKSQPP